MASYFHSRLAAIWQKNEIFSEFIKDTSVSTRQTVPFPPSDLTMLTSKIKKIIKGDGGAVGLLDNGDTLIECATCSPIIAAMLHEFLDDDLDVTENFHHHNKNSD